MNRTKNTAVVAAALVAGLVLGNLGVSFASSPKVTTPKPVVAVVSAANHATRPNVAAVTPSASATVSPAPKATHSAVTARATEVHHSANAVRTTETDRVCPAPRHQSSTGDCGDGRAPSEDCGR